MPSGELATARTLSACRPRIQARGGRPGALVPTCAVRGLGTPTGTRLPLRQDRQHDRSEAVTAFHPLLLSGTAWSNHKALIAWMVGACSTNSCMLPQEAWGNLFRGTMSEGGGGSVPANEGEPWGVRHRAADAPLAESVGGADARRARGGRRLKRTEVCGRACGGLRWARVVGGSYPASIRLRSASGSTGLVRWWLKPASSARRRSSACP